MQRPCDQFLSRSAFALNKYGFVRWPNTINETENLLHLRRIADDSRRYMVTLEDGFQLLVFFAQLVRVVGLSHQPVELLEADGFCQKLTCAQVSWLPRPSQSLPRR